MKFSKDWNKLRKELFTYIIADKIYKVISRNYAKIREEEKTSMFFL